MFHALAAAIAKIKPALAIVDSVAAARLEREALADA
jgi:hypothetical protein